MEYLKEELGSEVQGKEKAKDEIKELQNALGRATETRVSISIVHSNSSIKHEHKGWYKFYIITLFRFKIIFFAAML